MTQKDGTTISLHMSVTPAGAAMGSAHGFLLRIREVVTAKVASGPAMALPEPEMSSKEHQLRNLLTTIISNLDLVDRSVDD